MDVQPSDDDGIHDVITRRTGTHDVFVGDTGDHDVIIGSTGTHDVIVGDTGVHDIITRRTGTHDVIVDDAGDHDVITGSTSTHDVIVGDTGIHDVITGNTGTHDNILENTATHDVITKNPGIHTVLTENTGTRGGTRMQDDAIRSYDNSDTMIGHADSVKPDELRRSSHVKKQTQTFDVHVQQFREINLKEEHQKKHRDIVYGFDKSSDDSMSVSDNNNMSFRRFNDDHNYNDNHIYLSKHSRSHRSHRYSKTSSSSKSTKSSIMSARLLEQQRIVELSARAEGLKKRQVLELSQMRLQAAEFQLKQEKLLMKQEEDNIELATELAVAKAKNEVLDRYDDKGGLGSYLEELDKKFPNLPSVEEKCSAGLAPIVSTLPNIPDLKPDLSGEKKKVYCS